MARYLYRTCPKCKDYLGVVVPEPPEPVTEVPIDAHCLRCGFKLAWKVVTGGKSIVALLWLLLFLPLYATSAYPHGGGLDSYGCHHNQKQGTYHCELRITLWAMVPSMLFFIRSDHLLYTQLLNRLPIIFTAPLLF